MSPCDVIGRRVAQEHRVSFKEMKCGPRTQKIAKARHEYWFEVLMTQGYSLPRAARIVGGFNHTSLLYGVRKLATLKLGTRPGAGIEEIRAAWLASQAEAA